MLISRRADVVSLENVCVDVFAEREEQAPNVFKELKRVQSEICQLIISNQYLLKEIWHKTSNKG